MTSKDLIPFFAINFLCFVRAGFLVRRSRFYSQLSSEATAGRVSMIDGLRGWLALAVFFTHAASMYSWFAHGRWGGTQAGFFGMTGEVGVSLFFMITGFLFWGRVLRSGGRLNVEALYTSRLRRIVPMYLVSVAMSLTVVAALSEFTLQTSPISLIRELRAWLSFGYLYAGDINGVKDAHYINAVYWTLAYEWSFYIALPLLAVLARGWRSYALFPVAFIYCLQVPVTLNFMAGAFVAILSHKNLINGRLKALTLAPLPLASLAAVFMFPGAFALAPVALLFVFFLFVVAGNSLFGLLASRPAKLLGTISYSIYLTHCVVIYAVVFVVNAYLPIGSMPLDQYWIVVAAAAAICVLISASTYRYVEHPFIAAKPVVREPEYKTFDGLLEVRR
jgi:peptidoglycan/LPS O-acetylase OafA/YrhL